MEITSTAGKLQKAENGKQKAVSVSLTLDAFRRDRFLFG
jgi:hypothetical protein